MNFEVVSIPIAQSLGDEAIGFSKILYFRV